MLLAYNHFLNYPYEGDGIKEKNSQTWVVRLIFFIPNEVTKIYLV